MTTSEVQAKNAAHKINTNFDNARFCPLIKSFCRQDCMSWEKSVPIWMGVYCGKDVWGGASVAYCSNAIVRSPRIPEVSL